MGNTCRFVPGAGLPTVAWIDPATGGASLCRRWPFHHSRPGCRGVAAPGCL